MKTLIALFLSLLSFGAFATQPQPFMPVLMYHKFEATSAPSRENIQPSAFEQQLKWLRKEGYTTMSMQELTNILNGHAHMPPKAVAITIDDGWKTTLDAVQLLRKYDMSATVFVLSGTFDYPAYLSVDDLKFLSRQRYIEIGAHSHTHLMEWASNMDAAPTRTMMFEMAASKLLLEGVIGRPVTSFAWPFGYVRKEAGAYLPSLGYTSAVLVNPESDNARGVTTPFAIKRVNMDGRCSLKQFKAIVTSGRWERCDEKVD